MIFPPTLNPLNKITNSHYFIFSHSIHDYYTAGKYEVEALALLDELFKTHDTLVMSGGSGFYIDAVCKGIDNFPPTDIALEVFLQTGEKFSSFKSYQNKRSYMKGSTGG